MEMKKIYSLIGIIAVVVMLVWGYVGSFGQSWIALVIGALAIAVIKLFSKNEK